MALAGRGPGRLPSHVRILCNKAYGLHHQTTLGSASASRGSQSGKMKVEPILMYSESVGDVYDRVKEPSAAPKCASSQDRPKGFPHHQARPCPVQLAIAVCRFCRSLDSNRLGSFPAGILSAATYFCFILEQAAPLHLGTQHIPGTIKLLECRRLPTEPFCKFTESRFCCSLLVTVAGLRYDLGGQRFRVPAGTHTVFLGKGSRDLPGSSCTLPFAWCMCSNGRPCRLHDARAVTEKAQLFVQGWTVAPLEGV